jgi:Uma2 family endonuclease
MDVLTVLEKLEEHCDIKFELISGKIVPKEASEPLPQEILDSLLNDTFDYQNNINWLLMATSSVNHREIVAKLNELITRELNYSQYNLFIQDMKIKPSFLRTFLLPDLTFTLQNNRAYDATGALENPISVIEILSPSTEKKDRNEKMEAYKSIDSLQEYVLIAQDSYKIEQYLRQGKTAWTVKIYNQASDSCILTVGIKIKLNDLYKNTDWAKNE